MPCSDMLVLDAWQCQFLVVKTVGGAHDDSSDAKNPADEADKRFPATQSAVA